MANYESCMQAADDLLAISGFDYKNLAEIDLPDVMHAENGDKLAIPYAVFGDVDAPNVVLESAPMFTELASPHYMLRLKAQQEALGAAYALIGIQGFEPTKGSFTAKDRAEMVKGSFTPLSERVFRVGEELELDKYGQNVLAYGYSLGADVAIQVTNDTLTNPSRGVFDINALGAVEAARIANRGLVATQKAFGDSGKQLFDNVVASNFPALEEAWKIAPFDGNARKKFDKAVIRGLAQYIRSGPKNNFAILRGFGTDASAVQLDRIMTSKATKIPVMLGRQYDSTVCTEDFHDEYFKRYGTLTRFRRLAEEGDHSADDNIRKSAGRILYFAQFAVEHA